MIRKFLLLFVLVLILLHFLLSVVFERTGSGINYGVTFSPRYAGYLGLDWQKTYTSMLDELQVKHLRIPSYWNVIEPMMGGYDFSQTDFMLNEAQKRGTKVILVLGMRQPRWPECHMPAWAKNLDLPQRQEKILQFIEKTVEKYEDHPAIWAWQVENEPLLTSFGEDCDDPDKEFLRKEISLVKSLSNKPVIMTDSGELGFWKTSMSLSDIFGTTLYRQVHNSTFGYTPYPLPPYFYSLKSGLVRNLFARNNRKTIIVELQAEPWLAGGVLKSAEEQAKIFSARDFKKYVNFAQKTGFDEVYLWGVEWWYFMKEKGYPEYLEYAKNLF